jgi:hypothetical protein
MTNHLEWHNHAFIDENNIVIDVAVFDEWAHNHQLLEAIKFSIGAKEVICCCTFGIANIGDEWTGLQFKPKNLFPSWIWDDSSKKWKAPVSMPEDGFYIWREETKSWEPVPQE